MDKEDFMNYLPDMEQTEPDIAESVLSALQSADFSAYTAKDVESALAKRVCTKDDLKALLSPAAEPLLEKMAKRARAETSRHFGNSVMLFTPLYIDNHCENHCLYCGFRGESGIRRRKLDIDEIKREMDVIAKSGIEEILILTGEVSRPGYIEYIGEACRASSDYFRMTGLEVFPMNTEDYKYLHECGADYVTVFQETYDAARYGELHPAGRKRIWPYRFHAQERALEGGMRGAGFAALFGLSDFRRDALAVALHASLVQRKYPGAEISLSCPRLRPVIGGNDIVPMTASERQLCQILCAWRIFLPFAGITLSSRENARFRSGMVKIAATKISAGVSTGVGDHARKYHEEQGGGLSRDDGDEQFEISDSRSFDDIYNSLKDEELQPVVNDYVYV